MKCGLTQWTDRSKQVDTLVHERAKLLKIHGKSMFRKIGSEKAEKPLLCNGLRPSRSLLRQVWIYCGRNDRRPNRLADLSAPHAGHRPAAVTRPTQQIAAVLALGWVALLAPGPSLAEGGIMVTEFARASDREPGSEADAAGWTSESSFTISAGDGSTADPEAGIQVTDFMKKAPKRGLDTIPVPAKGSPLARLFHVIEAAESPGAGYDAVHGKAAIRPPAPPSQLTLAEIVEWIEDTPGQFHAIGRYQIVPDTLAMLIERSGVSLKERFDADLQDRFAVLLVEDAGYPEFLAGKLSLESFMDRLARVWAGLPLSTGKSAYHGYAGNRATVTRPAYLRAMTTIFPQDKLDVAALQ